MEFKIQIFQAWKVMELGLGPGKWWNIMENKPNGCCISDPCTFAKFWTHHFSVLNSTLFCFDSTFWLDSTLKLNCVVHKLIDLVHVYENQTCLISIRLNSPGKTWKMDINGPGKSWKTHIKRSWKVMKNHHFRCSVLMNSFPGSRFPGARDSRTFSFPISRE